MTNIVGSDVLRRRLMTAIGASALLAFVPQCSDGEAIDCPTPPWRCFDLQEAASCGDAAAAGAASTAVASTCPAPSEAQKCAVDMAWRLSDKPAVQNGARCCYEQVQPLCPGGRPFTVDGIARTASSVVRSDWSRSLQSHEAAAGDAADAAVIARGWLEDGFAEHASIASFARFTLGLLALGAPSDLVLAAQRAGLDEVRHARLCFALAARHSGESLGPGALEMQNALDARDLGSFAVRTVREGCVGETIAALHVAEQARWATDPALRRALEGVARDEASHAELAWKAVRWAIEQGGESVREAVARAFDEALRPVAPTRLRAEPDLRRHGRLRSVDMAQVKARALVDVVGPCAQALLNG
jgi:hypothetical protein